MDSNKPEYISIIASGIKIPDKEFAKISKDFKEIKSKREKTSVSYGSVFSDLDLDDEDDDLDMDVKSMNNPDTVDGFFKEKVVNTPLNKVRVESDGIDPIDDNDEEY